MAIAEAMALVCIGLFSGILATMCDVLFVGAASFVAHFSLWVLLNALITVHVESRAKAIWWAIPFNFGFIESYFITTVASYEGFSKSFVVPLALVAIISPLLTFGIWTAKREKNAYGHVLSLLIVLGTLLASFLVNGTVSIYAIVMSLLLAFVLLKMPVHRLSITRGIRKQVAVPEAVAEAGAVREVAGMPRPAKEGKAGRAASESRSSMRLSRRAKHEVPEAAEQERPRRSMFGLRGEPRSAQNEDKKSRTARERRRTPAHAPKKATPERRRDVAAAASNNGMSTLGTARVARRSTRSTSRRSE